MTDPRPNSPEDVGFTERPARADAAPAGSAPSPSAPRHEPKSCRSCGAAILWCQVLDEKGEVVRKPDGRPKAIPVDFGLSEKGNVQLYDRGGSIVARVLGAEHAQQIRDTAWALQGTHSLRMPHFATCPQASSWRKS